MCSTTRRGAIGDTLHMPNTHIFRQLVHGFLCQTERDPMLQSHGTSSTSNTRLNTINAEVQSLLTFGADVPNIAI